MVLLPDLKRKAEEASERVRTARIKVIGRASPSRAKRLRHFERLEQRAWNLYHLAANEPPPG